MINWVLAGILWASLLMILYVYIGYPLLLLLIRFINGERLIRRGEIRSSLTIIVAAHNEEDVIGRRLENVRDQQYPPERMGVIVASDGSTDGTTVVAQQLARELPFRVDVLASPEQVGRATMHNRAAAMARGDVLLFTDADTRFPPHFLATLLRYFADERVGCVSGRVVYENIAATAVSRGLGWYWRYEQWLRRLENSVGVYCFSSGACVAIRRSAYRALEPTEDIDTVCPLDVVLQGRWTVHADDAECYERLPATTRGEIGARIRMIMQSMEGRVRRPALLNPLKYPGYALAIFSHKILRWHTAYFLLAALLSNALLAAVAVSVWWDLLLALQAGFYGLGVMGAISERRYGALPLASLVLTFCIVNIGFLIGTWRFARGMRVSAYRSME